MRVMGDYLVWEKDGGVRTLNIYNIEYTLYWPAGYAGSPGPTVHVMVGGKTSRFVDHNAEWFHKWWMQHLEEEEELNAKTRESSEQWQARHSGPNTCSTPAKEE